MTAALKNDKREGRDEPDVLSELGLADDAASGSEKEDVLAELGLGEGATSEDGKDIVDDHDLLHWLEPDCCGKQRIVPPGTPETSHCVDFGRKCSDPPDDVPEGHLDEGEEG